MIFPEKVRFLLHWGECLCTNSQMLATIAEAKLRKKINQPTKKNNEKTLTTTKNHNKTKQQKNTTTKPKQKNQTKLHNYFPLSNSTNQKNKENKKKEQT